VVVLIVVDLLVLIVKETLFLENDSQYLATINAVAQQNTWDSRVEVVLSLLDLRRADGNA
jgi:hypothetical protein